MTISDKPLAYKLLNSYEFRLLMEFTSGDTWDENVPPKRVHTALLSLKDKLEKVMTNDVF